MQDDGESQDTEVQPSQQHQASAAAEQAQVPHALSIEQRGVLLGDEGLGGLRIGDREGPLEQGSWHRPFDEDPMSPASSSGSALDPQLFR